MPPPAEDPRYAPLDLRARDVLGPVGVGLVTLALLLLATWFVWVALLPDASDASDLAHAAHAAPTAGPRIEPTPLTAATLARARDAARLSALGVVDRTHGVATIPIEDAMRLSIAGVRAAPDPPASAAQEPLP